MRYPLRQVGWILGGAVTIIAFLIASRFALNLARSEARGARSLRELSAHAEPPVRDAARAALAQFATQPWMRGIEWVAVVDRRPHGDTLVLGLFRAEDATVLRRMVMPHPYVSGVIRYDTARMQLLVAATGVE
jgi:hypothetical protein